MLLQGLLGLPLRFRQCIKRYFFFFQFNTAIKTTINKNPAAHFANYIIGVHLEMLPIQTALHIAEIHTWHFEK